MDSGRQGTNTKTWRFFVNSKSNTFNKKNVKVFMACGQIYLKGKYVFNNIYIYIYF